MEKKPSVNLNIFLIKKEIKNFRDCLKEPDALYVSFLKPTFGLDGEIFYSKSREKKPKWKTLLDKLTDEPIEGFKNSSSKALMLVRIKKRIMVIVFGYGRFLLKEECIERNFGLKVALNIIDESKMRSVRAITIEDMVVFSQMQATYDTTQEQFGLNNICDIMNQISGKPYGVLYGNRVSGADSLSISVPMEVNELKEKLELYFNSYNQERYKEIGFEWVDNINEIKDKQILDKLDNNLIDAIQNKKLHHMYVSPIEVIDWGKIKGFCFEGMRKSIEKAENYSDDLDLELYIKNINPESNISDKLRRDRIFVMENDENYFSVGSVYKALIYETEYNLNRYILCGGSWYYIENNFSQKVENFLDTIVVFEELLPNCPSDFNEAQYNAMVSAENNDYCLMDRKLIQTENERKQIEACDIFTKNKQFIHIKNKTRSSQLSHLFSQGKISAECFVSDELFRKQVFDVVSEKLGEYIFKYNKKPSSNEFTVLYAIIDARVHSVKELPFFSKVNLMLTVQELEKMHFKCAVTFVKREEQDV